MSSMQPCELPSLASCGVGRGDGGHGAMVQSVSRWRSGWLHFDEIEVLWNGERGRLGRWLLLMPRGCGRSGKVRMVEAGPYTVVVAGRSSLGGLADSFSREAW
jgi:hypothetical protein